MKLTQKQATALYLDAFYSYVAQIDYTDDFNRSDLNEIIAEISEQIHKNYTLKNDLTAESVAEFLAKTIFSNSENDLNAHKEQLLFWINEKLGENDPIKNYFGN